MSIDLDKIKIGDKVRVQFHTDGMKRHGVPPVEFETTAHGVDHDPGANAWVIGFWVRNPLITILEHIPARPDWADALVVRDRYGTKWGHHRNDNWVALYNDPGDGTDRSTEDLARNRGPITVVLEANGNPRQPEVEWLDADELDELPPLAIVQPKSEKGLSPRWCGSGFARWCYLGDPDNGKLSEEIAPARILWKPEDK